MTNYDNRNLMAHPNNPHPPLGLSLVSTVAILQDMIRPFTAGNRMLIAGDFSAGSYQLHH